MVTFRLIRYSQYSIIVKKKLAIIAIEGEKNLIHIVVSNLSLWYQFDLYIMYILFEDKTFSTFCK